MKSFYTRDLSGLANLSPGKIELDILNEDHDGIPIVIAPGFLTQGSDDWKTYIASKIDAPIYYVKWRSSSVLHFASKHLALNSARSLLSFTNLTLKGMGLLASAYMEWKSAANEANQAGVALARFLNDIWYDDDKAVFIGHSLGVRVITEAMRNLTHDNALTSISIAGALNRDEYDRRITAIASPRTIVHTNVYSTNDQILKWVYRVGEMNYSRLAVGLECSGLANVLNHQNAIGHTEYHDNEEFGEFILACYNDAVRVRAI